MSTEVLIGYVMFQRQKKCLIHSNKLVSHCLHQEDFYSTENNIVFFPLLMNQSFTLTYSSQAYFEAKTFHSNTDMYTFRFIYFLLPFIL